MTDCIYFYLGSFFLLPVIFFFYTAFCLYTLVVTVCFYFILFFSCWCLILFFYFLRISIFSEPFLPTLVMLLFFSFVINVRGYELPGRFTLLALLALSSSFPFNSYRVQKTKKQNKSHYFIFPDFKKYIYMTKAVNFDTQCSKRRLILGRKYSREGRRTNLLVVSVTPGCN